MKNDWKIWACSIALIILSGCSLTLGPVVERKSIIVQAGVPIECLEQIKVRAHILKDKDGETDVFIQDIGGWIMMHPDHWKSLKETIDRLKKKCGEK